MTYNLLYLDVPGVGLSVRESRLIVKTYEGEMVFIPQAHRLQCIILVVRGFITTDALAWLSQEHVAVFIVWENEFLTMMNATAGKLARGELAVRRRQMGCVLDPRRKLEAARSLVEAKIAMLKLGSAERIRFTERLAKASSIEDAMVMEAEAGATYWRSWQGRELRFKDGTKVEFGARARSWKTGRLGETGKQFSNRFALHPVNAMINYAGAIMVAQCARACAGLGLDVGFGVLHSTRPGMMALAWDVFELLRVRTEEAVFGFVGSRKFEAREFKIVREPKPHVRFGREVGRELTAHVMKAVPFKVVVKTCREVMELF